MLERLSVRGQEEFVALCLSLESLESHWRGFSEPQATLRTAQTRPNVWLYGDDQIAVLNSYRN